MFQNNIPGITIERKSKHFVVILEGIIMILENEVQTKISFLIHKARTKNRRKRLILIEVEKNNPMQFKIVLMK